MNAPIVLTMPASPMSAMPLRLFISGLAARLGFDIDEIEDIKSVVSEVCVLLFNGLEEGVFEMRADLSDGLGIYARLVSDFIRSAAPPEDYETVEMSKMLITALADSSEIEESAQGCVTGVRVSFKLGD